MNLTYVHVLAWWLIRYINVYSAFEYNLQWMSDQLFVDKKYTDTEASSKLSAIDMALYSITHFIVNRSVYD